MLAGDKLPGAELANNVGMVVTQLRNLGLGTIPTTVDELNNLIRGLDLTQASGRQAYASLVNLAPTFVELQNIQESLYEQVLSDQERSDRAAMKLKESFNSLGISVPLTREAFKELIDSQDETTVAGARLKAQLLGLVPAFMEAGAAFEQLVQSAKQAAEESARDALKIAEEAVKKATDVANSFKSLKQDLLRSELSPLSLSQKAQWSGQRFNNIFSMAKGGDQDALRDLPSASKEYLNYSMQTAGSAEEYTRTYAFMQAVVSEAGAKALSDLDIAKLQLEDTQRQTSVLLSIDEGVTTLAEAMAKFQTDYAAYIALTTAPTGSAITGTLAEPAYQQPTLLPPVVVAQPVVQPVITSPVEEPSHGLLSVWWQSGLRGEGGFAKGGMHKGGLRLVGENGPELEVTGPARIWNYDQTRNLLAGAGGGMDNGALLVELAALRTEVAQLRAATEATAMNTHEFKKQISRWDQEGMPGARETV